MRRVLGVLGGSPAKGAAAEARFEARDPRYSLERVVLPESTRREVEVLLSRIENHDLIYHTWGMQDVDPVGRCTAVNFYGLPGTGKTMLAEALAARLGRRIVEANYAEIESKYVGETSKNIERAFQSAAAMGQAGAVTPILFFDEADSILGRRMTDVTQAADHAVNVARATMLKQLDSFDGIVVFATNLAKNFDGAFVRRILAHVEVPPPDADGRRQLWQAKIPVRVPGRNELDWDWLARESDGLVGGEIRNAVVAALAAVAARPESERTIRPDDLSRAIEHIRRAKRDVGHHDDNSPVSN